MNIIKKIIQDYINNCKKENNIKYRISVFNFPKWFLLVPLLKMFIAYKK